MKLPFDGHFRRRLYLVRHGQAAASQPGHGIYGDAISLTAAGRDEAQAMSDALAGVPFEEAWCSDINRAQETARVILAPHGLEVTASERFTEMRGDIAAALKLDLPKEQKLGRFAYSMWQEQSGGRFFGGDDLRGYMDRVATTLESLVLETTASNVLIVSHSGFQRAALCWVLDAVPLGLAKLEQDSCCLNILDIDVSEHGEILRKHVRLANYTPTDPVKIYNRLTDGERLAMRLSEQLEGRDV